MEGGLTSPVFPMKTVCFYISDYGYGHAARAIALIRDLVLHDERVRIIVKTAGPFEFTRRSLTHPRIRTIDSRNDPDVFLARGGAIVDHARTRQAFLRWVWSWDDYIARERAFCLEHHIDLILSDIAPQPFEVAEALDIPSLAVSNFTWDTIYGHLFPDLEEVDILRDAYRSASFACVLPFEIGMEIFPRSERVGLVSRRITVSRQEMRRRHGISEDDLLVFVGQSPELSDSSEHGHTGDLREPGTPTPPETAASRAYSRPTWPSPFVEADGAPTVRYLVPSGMAMPGALAIPIAETESQNWIGMCDCVVAKCGYSTVSEAVRARVPLLVWKRDGFIEDEAIARKIELLGIGKAVSGAVEGIARLRDGRGSIRTFKENYDTLENQYTSDGIAAVLRVVGNMIR